jgi:Ca2+-transporting ATPase
MRCDVSSPGFPPPPWPSWYKLYVHRARIERIPHASLPHDMSHNLLDPKTLLDPRQRSLSDANTIVSAGPSINTSKTTATPSLADADLQQALAPDPGTEADFEVANNPFDYSPGQLNKLFNPKSAGALRALGGLEGLARGLHADINAGLSVDEAGNGNQGAGEHDGLFAADRIRVYGRNQLPPKKPKSIWRLAWITFQEAVLILLTVAGTISLALGLYETFGTPREPGAPTPVAWVEGVAILAAVVIVVVVASHNDWQKEKAFVKLNTKKDDREVKVLRSGKSMLININQVLVGDVLYLEPGDLVPVDGIFIDGHNVKCDESSATGESDALKKTSGAKMFDEADPKMAKEFDPFIISGSRVIQGEELPHIHWRPANLYW